MLREYKKNRIKNVTSTNIKHTFIFLQGLLLMLLISSFVPTLNAKDFDDRVIKHIKLPKWFKESPFIELDDDLKSAQEKGKKGLMLFFTTEGCSYCDRFINKALADPEISTMVQKNFDSIGMEIFNDADITSPTGESITAKKFAKDVGVQFSPSLIFYGENGKQLLKLVGYQSPERFKKILNFLDKDLYKNETLGHYLKRQSVLQASVQVTKGLKHDPLFSSPPFILESRYRAGEKPLLVLFEKTNCEECEYSHKAVLALKEVRDMMKKFDVVRLDANDTKTPILAPNGQRITPAKWFEQTQFTRVPAMLLYNNKNNEVLKTDALVMRLRMVNSMKYVTERAYEKGWTFQRFGREKGRAKGRAKSANKAESIF